MNENNCKITGIHEPIKMIWGNYQCRYCHKTVTKEGVLIPKEPKHFDKENVYQQIVKYYMDKKGYSKEQANNIAQKEIERQMRLKN